MSARQSDFRYNTGDTRVPWGAVGETFNAGDIAEFVRFLLPPPEGDTEAYDRILASVGGELDRLAAVAGPIGKLTLGKRVTEAEAHTRDWLGVKYACLTNTWTAGMEIAYKLSGLRPGDEVILPAITFAACPSYPLTIGARVVFADVDPETMNMDPADVARKITPRTRVIMPVHIGGRVCDMDPIMELARKHDVFVIEDAAHALGSTYKGRFAGTIGQFGGYSLHEVKNINSLGEGGVLVSSTDLGAQFGLARFLGLDFSRQIPNWLYDVSPLRDRFGKPQAPGNASVTEIQAVAYRQQLARLEGIIAERARVADALNRRFADEEGILPEAADTAETRSSHHLYLLRIDPKTLGGDIQVLKRKLNEKGVTEVQHFGPLYKFSLFAELGYEADAMAATCPHTEECFNRVYTHLPLYGLTDEQAGYMADAVIASVREMKRGEGC